MDQREKIIGVAIEMFLDEGIRAVRMDDIAARLGVSKRTLYEIFVDKQSLIEQSIRHHLQNKHRRMAELRDGAGNVMEEIFVAIDAMKQNDRDASMVSNLRKFYPEVYGRLQQEARRFSHEAFEDLLVRGIDQGLLLPDMDRELALMTINFTVEALFDEKNINFAPLKHFAIQRAIQYVIVNFFRGVATKRGIEVIDELVEKNKKQI